MSKKKHNSKDISFREVCMKEQIIKTEILVKENKIGIIRIGNVNYISLTDLAKYQNFSDPSFTVKNWLRRVTTIDYVGLGNKYITKILIWSNSTKLKQNMERILLQCLHLNG